MTTLTIALAGSAIVNGSKVYTVSDADVQRLLDTMAPLAPGGSNGQILLAWVQKWIDDTIAQIKYNEANAAATAAAVAVQPVSLA